MPHTNFKLAAASLADFDALRARAIDVVTDRFYGTVGHEFAHFGEAGKKHCRDDIGFHLDFLRPVLDTGDVAPYIDHLRWFTEVLAFRNIPSKHIVQTMAMIGDFLAAEMRQEGRTVERAVATATLAYQQQPLRDPEVTPPPWPQQAAMEEALLSGNRKAGMDIFAQLLLEGVRSVEINVRVVEAALCHIGERWQRNEVTVAQEHLATVTARTVVTDAFVTIRPKAPNGLKALFAAVQGNQHSVGLNMVADSFEQEGWQVQYLGADMPTRDLVQHVVQWRPDLVGLSVAFPHQVPQARQVFASLRAAFPVKCPKLVVGGAAIKRFPALAGFIGADAFALNAVEATAELAVPAAHQAS